MYYPTEEEKQLAEEMAEAVMKSFLPVFHATNAYDLLEEVIAAIEQEPRRYDQGSWFSNLEHLAYRREECEELPNCGTMACIAGWIAIGTKREITEEAQSYRSIPTYAAAVLGFEYHMPSRFDDDDDGYNDYHAANVAPVQNLFDESLSGYRLDHEYGADYAVGTPGYAAIGIRKIRAFMAEHEARLKAKAV